MSDTNAVRNARWYLGEAFWETAERQGIINGKLFLAGFRINRSLPKADVL